MIGGTRAGGGTGTTRAVVYCRVSSAGQEDNSSLETQEAACRAHAADRGWQVVDVFREVHTGAELFERPQLARLREVLRGDAVDVVLAHAIDRLSRNQAHLGFLLSEWDHQGVRLELTTEDLDETPEGRLLQSVRGFVAEVERLKIWERTQRGTRARAESGKPLVGCRPPFGYRWRDAKKTGLIPDPDRAAVVRRIFDAALRGDTLRSTARALTAEAVPTPTGRGGLWAPSVLHRILTNPVYAGEAAAFRYATERASGGTTRVRVRPKEQQVPLPPGVAPPIVAPDEQRAVVARLEANKRRATRNNKNPEATLLRAGFARCGYCGSPLSVKHRRDGREAPNYRCAGAAADRYGCPGFAISAAILDDAIWSRIARLLDDPALIEREVARRRSSDGVGADLGTLDRRLRELAARQAKLARLAGALDDEDAAAPLLAELRSAASQRRDLEAERGRRQSLADEATLDANRLADLAAWCGRVAANLATLTYSEKRLVLDALGVRVQVWRSDHDPRWELTMNLPVVPLGQPAAPISASVTERSARAA